MNEIVLITTLVKENLKVFKRITVLVSKLSDFSRQLCTAYHNTNWWLFYCCTKQNTVIWLESNVNKIEANSSLRTSRNFHFLLKGFLHSFERLFNCIWARFWFLIPNDAAAITNVDVDALILFLFFALVFQL